MKHKQLHLSILALGALLGALVRFWNLTAAVDEHTLFIPHHSSSVALICVCILFVAALLLLSLRSPGRGCCHDVMVYNPSQSGFSIAAAGFLSLATLADFNAALSGSANLLLFLLALATAICMLLLSVKRKHGNQFAPPELVPVFFLLLKLILSFKNWSTDPVILDYFGMLFALIFALLAIYGVAGFCFDRGQPRKTLFYCSCSIFFSAMAAVDGFSGGNWPSGLFYLALILWLWPSVVCLLKPHDAPLKTDSDLN